MSGVHEAPASDPTGAEVPASTETTADATTANPTSDPTSGEAAPTTETTGDASTANPVSDPYASEVPNTHTEDTADANIDNAAGASDPTSGETPGVTETTADASTAGGGRDLGSDAPTAAEVTASNALSQSEHDASAAPASDPMGTDTPPTTGF